MSRRESRPRHKEAAGSAPQTLADYFGPEGPVAAALPHFEIRPEQLEVAEAVEASMQDSTILVAEAGTGVGKSLAYLIPAVRLALEGHRTVISTHTISLQTQLIEKDIPLVLSLFPGSEDKVQPVLMKGRGNYLCKQSMDNARSDLFLMDDPKFRRITAWSRKANCSGDSADLPFSFSAWRELTSSPETCKGTQCGFYGSCFYYKMRKEAAESKLIIVNHALLFSDLAMRADAAGAGLIPDYQHLVLDEAHHLEDVATSAFGAEFSSSTLSYLVDRVRHTRNTDVHEEKLASIELMSEDLFAPFARQGRGEFVIDEQLPPDVVQTAVEMATAISEAIGGLVVKLREAAKEDEENRERYVELAEQCAHASLELGGLLNTDEEGTVRWAEVLQGRRAERKADRVVLHRTPISIAERVTANLWDWASEGHISVALTSATLANSGGFSFLRSRIGLPETAVEILVGSPFDYKQNVLLYVPAHLPAPIGTPEYREAAAVEIERIVRLTQGRAFLLFTSYAMMNAMYERLLSAIPYPLFRQGDQPPGKLVQAFRESENGCLLGVQTFWEGVDVRGQALSCVIIDRIPFAVPDTPVTKARTQAIDAAGGKWFQEYSIPLAQIRLKQGFGRLVRTRHDCGLVCVLDSRLISRDYGPEFVKHLPPASRASLWPRVEKFWSGLQHDG